MGYACKTGRCSTCRCQVLDGTTRALHPEVGLEAEDRAAGSILSCVRTAESDVSLVAAELIPFDLPPVKIVPARIDALIPLRPDVLEVRLRLPPTARFTYLPGQYVDVIGAGGVRRSYSLAGGAPPNQLSLHIRHVPSGIMSDYWFSHAKIDDLLRLSGPLGTFFLRDVTGRKVIFMATGTGIAPVTAMLEGLAQPDASQPEQVTVIWGARHAADFYADLSSMCAQNCYWRVLSRPDPAWSGLTGYVQDALLAANFDLNKTVVYACGSDAMIRSAKHLLVSAGLSPDDFHSDAFVCSAAT